MGGAKPFEEMAARRIQVLEGDVSIDGLGLSEADRAVLATCDIVIHSAAAVAFDSPLDKAIEINLMGPVRVAQTLQSVGSTAHLVAVSTCYVAGNRRGRAPEELVSEGPFDIGISWKAEVAAARRLRSDVEAQSREPDRLRGLRHDEIGRAHV